MALNIKPLMALDHPDFREHEKDLDSDAFSGEDSSSLNNRHHANSFATSQKKEEKESAEQIKKLDII